MDYPSEKVRIAAPYAHTYRFCVKQKEAGKTIADLLHERFPFRSVQEWEKRIELGRVKLNDKPTSAQTLIKEYDVVAHFNPRVIEPSVPDDMRILQETEDFLFVFKPAPMPVHSGGRYFKNALTGVLDDYGYKKLHIIHRLDAVTSGILLFGKSKAFAQKAQQWFKENQVEKEYLALVAGVPDKDEFSCNSPISRDKGYKFKSGTAPGAKSAFTRFRVVERYGRHTLVKCYPETGRTHQIRLHLQDCGYPIANDPVYGPKSEKTEYQNRAIFLLHSRFSIPHENITCEIPMPESWLAGIGG